VEISEPILESDENIGFSTLIETTQSSLFSRPRLVHSDSFDEDAFWFSVYVPLAGSSDFVRLSQLVENGGVRSAAMKSATPILIEIAHDEQLLNSTPEKQAKFAHTLVNRFLRAYEHTYFDMLVPRHQLDGRVIVMITPPTHKVLAYSSITLDLSEFLAEYLPSHVDIEQEHLTFLMASPEFISPSWRILVDGARHFEKGDVREAILCACSAAEIVASPAVERWLEGNTLSGEGVKAAVREMGNPLRFDLCLSGACSDAFSDFDESERTALLADLRRMNRLRNAVVHQGQEPEAAEAAAALRSAASFVHQLWLASFQRNTES
jgi:hypothetical protein